MRFSARLGNPVLTGFFVALVLMLTGCATPQVAQLQATWPQGLPKQVELRQVPFFPQEDFECGPAALAMVMQAVGVNVTPQAMVEQVYLPARKGALQPEMLAASRRQGLLAYPLRPQLHDVLTEVAAGRPVLVFQNLSLPIYPVWHYAVVVGYDWPRQVLRLHSGRTAGMEISVAAFERTWSRGQNWAMLALQPGELPATAKPAAYTAAAAALERVNPRAAQQAYAAALQLWPDNRAALLGVGNTAYALGQRQAAQQAWQQAVTRHPDFADAWNNLAQVLLDTGNLHQASEAIARAVALGGDRLPAYRALQLDIDQQRASAARAQQQ